MHEQTSLKLKIALVEAETLRNAQDKTNGTLNHVQAAGLVRKCQQLDRRWQVSWTKLFVNFCWMFLR